jgi:hypothetical protein
MAESVGDARADLAGGAEQGDRGHCKRAPLVE